MKPQLQLPEFVQPPQAWLGLHVGKPDQTTVSHLPALPPGIGFVVKSVDAGGPAAKAGLQENDVLWKFGDQMLVNEAQLAQLLRISKPGDPVELAAFREGRPVTVNVVLGETPKGANNALAGAVDAAILPEDRGPTRVINVTDRQASFSTGEGRAVVRRDGSGYKVVILGPGKEIVFEGALSGEDDFSKVPREWRRRVCALRRGLDHALDNHIAPVRTPRARVVPPAAGR